jgi:hypothetical protein
MDDLEAALRRIKRGDLQAKLESYFVPASDLKFPSGRVYFPREYISVKDLIVSLLPNIESQVEWDADSYENLAEELFDSYGLDEILEWLTNDAGSWVVYCWETDSRVSGCWGIMRFSLGNRGYLYHRPDSGVGDDESLRILASWEPTGNEEAFKTCFLETYRKEWDQLVLPPKVSQWVDGPSALMQEAVLNILNTNPNEWRWIVTKFQEYFSDKTPEIADRVFRKLGISSRFGNRILVLLNDDAGALVGKLVRGEVDQEEFHALLDIFWAVITPEQKD